MSRIAMGRPVPGTSAQDDYPPQYGYGVPPPSFAGTAFGPSAYPPPLPPGTGSPHLQQQQQQWHTSAVEMSSAQHQQMMHVNAVGHGSPNANVEEGNQFGGGGGGGGAPPAHSGKAKDQFKFTMASHWAHWLLALMSMVLFAIGLVAVLVPVTQPGTPAEGLYGEVTRNVLVSIGAFFTFMTAVVFQPYVFVFERPYGSPHLKVMKWTVGLPPICMGAVNWESTSHIDSMEYAINHWITTSTDKHGRTHTHHHSCLVIDGVGFHSMGEDDVGELTEALGRPPARGSGEPDANLCLWCTKCPCGCY